ncbi:hypothetical protein ACO1O0_007267 [Amphichorda felina]
MKKGDPSQSLKTSRSCTQRTGRSYPDPCSVARNHARGLNYTQCIHSNSTVAGPSSNSKSENQASSEHETKPSKESKTDGVRLDWSGRHFERLTTHLDQTESSNTQALPDSIPQIDEPAAADAGDVSPAGPRAEDFDKKKESPSNAQDHQASKEAKKAQTSEEAKDAQIAEEAKKAQISDESKRAQISEEAKKPQAQISEEAKKPQVLGEIEPGAPIKDPLETPIGLPTEDHIGLLAEIALLREGPKENAVKEPETEWELLNRPVSPEAGVKKTYRDPDGNGYFENRCNLHVRTRLSWLQRFEC